MHPCPFCHSSALTLEERVRRIQRVHLIQIERKPPEWDYSVRDEHDKDLDFLRVTCDTCNRSFEFNQQRYQQTWPIPPDECPYEHESSCDFVREGCQACAWEEKHGAKRWDALGMVRTKPLRPRRA